MPLLSTQHILINVCLFHHSKETDFFLVDKKPHCCFNIYNISIQFIVINSL